MSWKKATALVLLGGVAAAGAAGGLAISLGQDADDPPASSTNHTPDVPAIVSKRFQTPAVSPAPITASADRVDPETVEKGRLLRLAKDARKVPLVAASQPDFPVSAKIPPTYYATFTTFNMLDGKVGFDLWITNFDPAAPPREKGAPALPDRVGVSLQLYPSGPLLIAPSGARVLDSVEVNVPRLKARLELRDERVTPQGGVQERVATAHDQVEVSGDRFLMVLAIATSPLNDAAIQELVAILSSVAVDGGAK